MDREYSFSGQREGEKVLEVIPSHPYVLYSPALKTALLLAAAFGVILYFPVLYIISIILLLFSGIYLFRAIYGFRETLLIVTDQRLFYVDQKGFFNRKISEVELNKILGITSETSGMAKVMLKYGDLIVRTAGAREDSNMVIKDIADPYSVEQRIANLGGIKINQT